MHTFKSGSTLARILTLTFLLQGCGESPKQTRDMHAGAQTGENKMDDLTIARSQALISSASSWEVSPLIFDAGEYLDRNPDLSALEDLPLHWVVYGMREGRQAHAGFRAAEYRELYPDLAQAFGADFPALAQHYVKAGSAEGRFGSYESMYLLPKIYDESFYRNLPGMPESLRHDSKALKKHWVRTGIFAGLQGSAGFSAKTYIEVNPDLRAVFATDYSAAIRHYIMNGIAEGRNTGLRGIPESLFLIGSVGYFSNGQLHYCVISSGEQWIAMGGASSGTLSLKEIPKEMTFDGACSLPPGLFFHGPTGYASNGSFHYCAIATPEQWKAMGGKDSGYQTYPAIPTSMINDGLCHLPGGFFFSKNTGYLATSPGRYCAVKSWDDWLELGGPVSGYPTYPIIPSSMTLEGACALPAKEPGQWPVVIPEKRVGIFYSTWHGFAYDAQQKVKANGRMPLNIEDVVRSYGKFKFSDIFTPHERSVANEFYWQMQPKNGYYCIYRKRSYEMKGVIPDCPGIPATLERHARQIYSAGIDYIVADMTNLPDLNHPQADVIQLRPFEVLLEEWALLRLRKIATPQVAAWIPVPRPETGSNPMYLHIMNLYNRPEYSDLIMRDKKTGKKVIYIVDPPDVARKPDPSIVAAIESNNGKKDIIVVRMWAQFPAADYNTGKWSFMTPCGGDQPTTDVITRNCNQMATTGSPLGTALTVAASYQMNYASLPYQAPGRLAGLTLRRQFVKAFEMHPDHLLLTSWNEMIAQPQPNPFLNLPGQVRHLSFSMGLEHEEGGKNLFVDAFGSEYTRDIEPTVEYGDSAFELMKSCLRVYRSGARQCTNTQESCCREIAQVDYSFILGFTNGNDHTTILHGVDPAPPGYRQVCMPIDPTPWFPQQICQNKAESDSAGAFVVFRHSSAERSALYRCISGSNHFLSKDSNCEGQKVERLLGYVANAPSSAMPRVLRRCFNPNSGDHAHVAGGLCNTGYGQESILGFVR